MTICSAGQTFLDGRYRVERFLDAGGMQEVYRAFDILLKRTLVIKVPMSTSGERRFLRSARLSAQISHPNAARTLDYFVADGMGHLIEELIHGPDLGKLTSRHGALDPYAVAHIIHQFARGLAAVHHQGVAHRDLKPSNLMCAGPRWTVKVTDFGVATLAGEVIDRAARGGGAGLTTSKTAVGALPYMAPEVVRAEPADPAADVWSFGAITFQLLTAEAPFGVAFMAIPRILEGRVPPLPPFARAAQFGILSAEIHGIIQRCLAVDPSARPTAAQLLDLCSRLCYPPFERRLGTVIGYPASTFGFIRADDGDDEVFFHADSVYGETTPAPGSKVWFGDSPGHPRRRAHPVVPMRAA